MKSKVKLSPYCRTVTIAIIIVFTAGIASLWGKNGDFLMAVLFFIGLIAINLFYYPTTIETSESALVIHRALKDKIIPYDRISAAERCVPSAGGLRLCGSGGLMGYWGYFNDIIIGSYFGYYGNRNQCILIRLCDGRQYVISCENPDKMCAEINSHITEVD